jgi:hypothetical protein
LDLQGSRGKLLTEDLHKLFLSQIMLGRSNQDSKMGCTRGREGGVGLRNVYKILVGKTEGKLPNLNSDIHNYRKRMLKTEGMNV